MEKCISGKLDAVEGKVSESEGTEVGGIRRSAQKGKARRHTCLTYTRAPEWEREMRQKRHLEKKNSWKISKFDKNRKPTDPESSAKPKNKENASRPYYVKPGKEKTFLVRGKWYICIHAEKNSLYAETPRGDDTTLAHLLTALFLKQQVLEEAHIHWGGVGV